MKGRLLLRTIVGLQVLVALSAAGTIRELIDYGSEVVPAVVARTVVMLLGSIIALRATFGAAAAAIWRAGLLVVRQIVVVAAAGPDEFVTSGSVLPPNEIYGSQLVIGLTRLQWWIAAGLAVLSMPVALFRLAASWSAATVVPIPFTLALWVVAAALVTHVVTTRYTARFVASQLPLGRVEQLFSPVGDERLRWRAAERLIALPADAQEGVHASLVAGLARQEPCERAWAAYVLIAQGRDDGTAMTCLREILRTPAAGCAVSMFSRPGVGAKAAPALPELIELVKARAPDFDAALRQMDAAYALGQIGPPAAAAVPYLFDRVREPYPELRRKSAVAIDRIDPTFAARCIADAASVVEALQDTGGARPLAVRRECEE